MTDRDTPTFEERMMDKVIAAAQNKPKAKRFKGRFCCEWDCESEAAFHIQGGSGHPDDNTDSCEAHVGVMLGTPDWAQNDNTWWDVSLIPESELDRWKGKKR
jgi:hypothetical protein